MPKIVDRLPYSTGPTYEEVGQETVQIKPYQIIVWINVTAADLLEWQPNIPRFPCILDPGNNHNFSIQERICRTGHSCCSRTSRPWEQSRNGVARFGATLPARGSIPTFPAAVPCHTERSQRGWCCPMGFPCFHPRQARNFRFPDCRSWVCAR